MAMKQLSKVIGLAAMASSGVVLADTPTLKQVLDASGITVSGYVDAAYTYYNTDTPTLLNYFDDSESSFGLKQAALTVSSLPKEGFGALVNVTAGSDAKYIHSAGSGSDFGEDGFDLTQAYVQYATGPFTIIGGKFNTLAGAEVIAPTGNTNISRSIAFLWALPFTHTGVRVAYAPADGLTLYAGLNNGWDQQSDTNDDKTLELGAIWSPTSMVTLAASVYNGKETIVDPITTLDTDTDRFLFDTVITIKPTDALSLVLNYDYGKQEDAIADGTSADDGEWTSIVGYVNYQFNEQWRISLRGEQFDDEDGYRIGLDGDGEKITAYTATVGYAPAANLELRGEIRMDTTDDEVLAEDGDADDSQMYMAVEALYKF